MTLISTNSLSTAAIALVLALTASCGRSPVDEGPDTTDASAARAPGQDASTGTAALCTLAPRGQFTFHVRNNTAATIYWSRVCGRGLPIVLDTPGGSLPTAPTGLCGFTCDDVYTRGVDPDGCTDCGLGTMGQVQPGASSDIAWDRRVYTPYAYSAACGPVAYAGQTCEEGHSLAPTTGQTGKIRICNGQNNSFCLNGRDVTFTIDTTKAEGAIELN